MRTDDLDNATPVYSTIDGESANHQKSLFFASSNQRLVVDVLEGIFTVEHLSTESGRPIHTEYGEGFRYSEFPYSDDKMLSLKALQYEKALSATASLVIRIFPNKKNLKLFEVEVEVYDSALGSLIRENLGSEFAQVDEFFDLPKKDQNKTRFPILQKFQDMFQSAGFKEFSDSFASKRIHLMTDS